VDDTRRRHATTGRAMRVGGVATIASAPDAGRRAVTPQCHRRHHHHRHRHRHRRRHGRSDAAAPTSSETSAVTREACYEFVRSGCKPRESFRYARTAATVNARTAAAAAGERGTGGRGTGGIGRLRVGGLGEGANESERLRRRTERSRRWDARRGGRERDDDDDARWTTRWTTDRLT
jgi:hypothetical protein